MTVTFNYHSLRAALAGDKLVRYVENRAKVTEAMHPGEAHTVEIEGVGKATEEAALLVATTRRIFFEAIEKIRSA